MQTCSAQNWESWLLHPIHPQIWLVAEGAVESPADLMTLLGVDYDRWVAGVCVKLLANPALIGSHVRALMPPAAGSHGRCPPPPL